MGRWGNRVILALLAGALTVGLQAVSATAEDTDPPGGWGSGSTKDGAEVFLTKAELADFTRSFVSPPKDGPWFDFASASVCGGHPDKANSDNLCRRAVVMCLNNTEDQGLGPAVALFRRQVQRAGMPVSGPAGEWAQVGITCLPQLAPGNNSGLTMAMIRDAFHDTDFAVPTVNIQPEGDVTLVNLPTYFEVKFPEAGFGPEEIDTPDPSRLLGYRIEVRPVLRSVTFHLGETTIGPTESLGGPHPTGDVRATYSRPGQHQVRADITYTGQFRVGGGEWFDIPGQVDLQGTPVTLTVREARARLYSTP